MDNGMYAKAVNAKSAVELKAIVKEYGIELSDEKANEFYERLNMSSNISDQELEQVAGGCLTSGERCPRCGWDYYKPQFGWPCERCGYLEGRPGKLQSEDGYIHLTPIDWSKK